MKKKGACNYGTSNIPKIFLDTEAKTINWKYSGVIVFKSLFPIQKCKIIFIHFHIGILDIDYQSSNFLLGGSLLIMEKILNENRDGPELAMANDLMLSLMTKGRERSSSEYQKLLSTHGFTHMKVKHIQGFNYYDVILAKKPF